MVSNLSKGALIFAAIYSIVLVLSFGLASVRASASHNPLTANTVLTTSATSATSSLNVEVLVYELVAVSIIAMAEMKFGALSKLYRFVKEYFKAWHPLLVAFMQAFILVGIDFLIWRYWGFAWFLFLTINGGGILLAYLVLLRRSGFKELIPIFVVFMSFLVMWPYSLYFVGENSVALILLEFAYLPCMFLVATLVMKHPTQIRMNVLAFAFSVLLPPFIGTLFTPAFAMMLLVIFSVYDFVAVFITKHMGFLAQRLLSMNVPEAFMIGDMKLIQAKLKSMGKGKSPKIKESERPLIFGVGDAVIPSILISSFALSSTPKFAIATTIGCIFGVMANLFVLRRMKRILPALPLICCCVLIAVGIAALL